MHDLDSINLFCAARRAGRYPVHAPRRRAVYAKLRWLQSPAARCPS